jgi:hypothetical protein
MSLLVAARSMVWARCCLSASDVDDDDDVVVVSPFLDGGGPPPSNCASVLPFHLLFWEPLRRHDVADSGHFIDDLIFDGGRSFSSSSSGRGIMARFTSSQRVDGFAAAVPLVSLLRDDEGRSLRCALCGQGSASSRPGAGRTELGVTFLTSQQCSHC